MSAGAPMARGSRCCRTARATARRRPKRPMSGACLILSDHTNRLSNRDRSEPLRPGPQPPHFLAARHPRREQDSVLLHRSRHDDRLAGFAVFKKGGEPPRWVTAGADDTNVDRAGGGRGPDGKEAHEDHDRGGLTVSGEAAEAGAQASAKNPSISAGVTSLTCLFANSAGV
jgi:hypothetical protein